MWGHVLICLVYFLYKCHLLLKHGFGNLRFDGFYLKLLGRSRILSVSWLEIKSTSTRENTVDKDWFGLLAFIVFV